MTILTLKKAAGAALSILVCLPILTGCDSGGATAPETIGPRPIKAIRVEADQTTTAKRYPGRVRAAREADLSFRVAGRLIDLPVLEGQAVAQGQVVARLDPRDFRLRRDKAKAAYDTAKRQFERYRSLVEKKSVSQATFDSAQNDYQTAKASYEEAEAALRDTRLVAPFRGVISKRYVENHQDLAAKVPVVNLQDLDRLEVEVQVPEKDVVEAGGRLDYELSVALDARPGLELPASTAEHSARADSISQTFKVRVTFNKPQGVNVLPGMTAELIARRKKTSSNGRVLVPLAAVFVDAAGQNCVWKIKPDTETAHKVEVNVAGLDKGRAVISAGLEPGEMIASAGVHHLQEGMPVRVMEDRTESNDQ